MREESSFPHYSAASLSFFYSSAILLPGFLDIFLAYIYICTGAFTVELYAHLDVWLSQTPFLHILRNQDTSLIRALSSATWVSQLERIHCMHLDSTAVSDAKVDTTQSEGFVQG